MFASKKDRNIFIIVMALALLGFVLFYIDATNGNDIDNEPLTAEQRMENEFKDFAKVQYWKENK